VSLRWVPPLHQRGCWQMAIDSWLLDRAVAHRDTSTGERQGPIGESGAALRFYTWALPTLSLGHHQRGLPPHWQALQQQGVIDLVRRPSGGRAVLHHRELTYALIWPGAPARRREAYHLACRWLQDGFARIGLPLRRGEGTGQPDNTSCFASSSFADLVHANGAKRIGNAQLWRRGVLLQHGSILLAPDQHLWRTLLGEAPPLLPPLPVGVDDLISELRLAAQGSLPIATGSWQEQSLSTQEWDAIAEQVARFRIPAQNPSGQEPG